jgi:tRNA(Ser,Leu) C12 N-acetylase TAN1
MNKSNRFLIHLEKIYEILDFITKEEQTTILNILSNTTEDDWPAEVDNEFTKNDPSLSGKVYPITEVLETITREIDLRIQSCFENNG